MSNDRWLNLKLAAMVALVFVCAVALPFIDPTNTFFLRAFILGTLIGASGMCGIYLERKNNRRD